MLVESLLLILNFACDPQIVQNTETINELDKAGISLCNFLSIVFVRKQRNDEHLLQAYRQAIWYL